MLARVMCTTYTGRCRHLEPARLSRRYRQRKSSLTFRRPMLGSNYYSVLGSRSNVVHLIPTHSLCFLKPLTLVVPEHRSNFSHQSHRLVYRILDTSTHPS